MNDFQELIKSKQNQTLFVVEGIDEKRLLLKMILRCYPELPICLNNVYVYDTDIYDLYHEIEEEYGSDWFDEENEIDIPLIVSRKKQLDPQLDKRKFTNIILIFDYERHDNWFSDEKILRLQKHFNSATDDGILYINFPMVEAYQHMEVIPDLTYMDKYVSVKCNPGTVYKNLVHSDSLIWKYLCGYKAMLKQLRERTIDFQEAELEELLYQVLALEDKNNLLEEIGIILRDKIGNTHMCKTLSHCLHHSIMELGYIEQHVSYLEKLREMFNYIIIHNMIKAFKIQNKCDTFNGMSIKEIYQETEFVNVLLEQNLVSSDSENGIIWVLCTCLSFLGEYKFLWKERVFSDYVSC